MVCVASFYRFMIEHDYLVGYEGSCDPVSEVCFTACEDDACTEIYYYSNVQKYAPDLVRECGKDITDCEAASMCLPSDHECSVTYCDPETNGDACEMINENIEEEQNNDQEIIEEELLQNNEVSNTNI